MKTEGAFILSYSQMWASRLADGRSIAGGVLRATPTRGEVLRDTALTALADKDTLQFMNEGLVRKCKEWQTEHD
jgi:hypothetical protein